MGYVMLPIPVPILMIHDCGCYGTITNDTDNDGTCDAIDQCPSFNNEIDMDNDGIPYCLDNCVDVDEDSICDDVDNNVIVDDLKIRFSHERGFYENTFSLNILSNDPNAIIKYSTTQSIIPSVSAGAVYQNPIPITIPNDGIFVVKAFTYNSYDTTKVKTHSYVFLDQVHQHNATFANINNDPQYGPILRQGFTDLPSVSIFVDNNQAINGSSDSKISIEWLYPQNLEDEGPNHQVDAGVRYSSGGVNGAYPKQSLKIYFRKEHGYGKLEI